MKKLLVSTLVAASLASAPPAHAGNYDGLLVGGIIAGGLIAAAAAAAANHPHVVYQQGPTRVIYKRAPTRVIYVARPAPCAAPRKAAVVAPPAHQRAPAWTDLHQGAAAVTNDCQPMPVVRGGYERATSPDTRSSPLL